MAALKNLASYIEIENKILFLEIQTAIKQKLGGVFKTLSQRHNRCDQITEVENVCIQGDFNDSYAATQFFRIHKNQLIELQKHLERKCNVLSAFGFNSAK